MMRLKALTCVLHRAVYRGRISTLTLSSRTLRGERGEGGAEMEGAGEGKERDSS